MNATYTVKFNTTEMSYEVLEDEEVLYRGLGLNQAYGISDKLNEEKQL